MTQVLLCQERVARLSHNVPINPSDCADLLLISPDVASYAKVDQDEAGSSRIHYNLLGGFDGWLLYYLKMAT